MCFAMSVAAWRGRLSPHPLETLALQRAANRLGSDEMLDPLSNRSGLRLASAPKEMRAGIAASPHCAERRICRCS
jgi:hypothetical protein